MFGRRKPIESASRNDTLDKGTPASKTTGETKGPTLVVAEGDAGKSDAASGTSSSDNTKGSAMSSTPTSKPQGSFVPEIPRRTVDIPGAARRPTPRANIESRRLLVGKDISLSGEITACDVLVVEGTVTATLEHSQVLEVTETGTVRGKVQIEEAVIAGLFEGTLTAREKLTVKSTGRIIGTVRFGQLEVELGGSIKGDTGPLEEPIRDEQNTPNRDAATPLGQMKEAGAE